MVADIINMLWYIIDSVFVWLSNIFESVDLPLLVIIPSLVALYSIFHYVLSPMFMGSSDKSKRREKD